MLQSGALQNLGLILVVYYTGWILYARWLHPLARFPGPPLASISRLWVILHVARGNAVAEQRELHRKYGAIVRIAPNELIINDARSLKTIYGFNSGFTKTDFYLPFRSPFARYPDHFSAIDEQLHAKRRRIVNQMYSMTKVLQAEKYVDNCMDHLLEKFEELAQQGATIDFYQWARMYAYDVVGEFFFGRPFGLLQKGHDFLGYTTATDFLIPVMAVAGVMPSYVRSLFMLGGLIFSRTRKAFKALEQLAHAADVAVEERMDNTKKIDGLPWHPDLLSRVFEIYYREGEALDYKVIDVKMEAFGAFFGGSDTTAISMASIIFYILRDREIYGKVLDEIDTATSKGALSVPHIAYREAVKLPFLSACIKEAMRVHPSTGLTLPRLTPKEGSLISGYRVPGGARIGANAVIVQSDKSVFGGDADEFRPERWLHSGADGLAQYSLQFGAGSRTCMGKHIAMCEIYKVIPQILRTYHLELDSPVKPSLRTTDYWFHKPIDLNLKLRRREVRCPN
ncbi:cytochrome P450 [Aspergillus homomorphus CBS 101889]|uniref:Cytochrome P450 n=1 Tax=Aspergillus homomorphus (strain CBS 101889) TaxID=1450537 RepID=A0A395HQR1_ASPHC|nr:cytochrome P450 [Aspergillus homomorphus CBS 101889]RAL10282.1 cytochrome P450 [Aspergillus homomorphus CBS 101889]